MALTLVANTLHPITPDNTIRVIPRSTKDTPDLEMDAAIAQEYETHQSHNSGDLRYGLVRAMDAYVSNIEHGYGRTALEIGAELLEQTGGLNDPAGIIAATVQALRSRQAEGCFTEVVLAAVGAMAMMGDMPDDTRHELLSLVEAGLALVDQQAALA